MEELVWFGNRLIPLSDVHISPLDRGFLYGDGLFETMRSYGGTVHLLRRHLNRLQRGCRVLRLRLPSEEYLRQGIASLLEGNNVQDARIRITVSRGVEADGDSTLLIRQVPLLQNGDEILKGEEEHAERFDLPPSEEIALLPYQRRLPEIFPRLKSLNYLPEILALDDLRRRGLREGLFLTPVGFVAEGSVSNLFCVVEGMLLTPPIDLGILPGITRERILELAGGEGLPVAERPFTLDELYSADECFYTNSIREIVPVRSVAERTIGTGESGPVTRQLYDLYRREAPNEYL